MGLYDTVTFEGKLKGFKDKHIDLDKLDFQTKDLDCFIYAYKVKNGQLYKEEYDLRLPTEEEKTKRGEEYRRDHPKPKYNLKKDFLFRLQSLWSLLKEVNPIWNKPVMHNVRVFGRYFLLGIYNVHDWEGMTLNMRVRENVRWEKNQFHGVMNCYATVGDKWLELNIRFDMGKVKSVSYTFEEK